MSRRKLKAGSTSVTVPLFVQDTSSTTGGGLGSLVFNSSGLAAKYRREGDSAWTTITLATATVGTWASGGFVADGGPVTGGYEFGVPNAVLAAGKTWAQVEIYGAANMLPVLLEFELDTIDYQASGGKVPVVQLVAGDFAANSLNGKGDWLTAGGYTAPNNAGIAALIAGVNVLTLSGDSGAVDGLIAAGTSYITNGYFAADPALATAAGQAVIAGYIDTEVAAIKAKTDQLNFSMAGAVDANATYWAGLETVVHTASGATTQRPLVACDLRFVMDGLLTDTADRLAAAFSTFFNVASPTLTCQSANQTGDNYARLGAPAGASLSADVAAVKTDTGTTLTDVNTGAGAIYTRIGAPAGVSIAADIAAVNAKTANLPASPAAVGSAMTLTTGERDAVAAALLDLANGVETSLTVRRVLKDLAAVLTGTNTGANTGTEVYNAGANSGTPRLTYQIDGSGNRTSVTRS